MLTISQAGDEIVAIGGQPVAGRATDLVAMLRACTSIALTVRPASDLLFQVDPALKQEVRFLFDGRVGVRWSKRCACVVTIVLIARFLLV
jgi:hypothetical protein